MADLIEFPMKYEPQINVVDGNIEITANLENGNVAHICTLNTNAPAIQEALGNAGWKRKE